MKTAVHHIVFIALLAAGGCKMSEPQTTAERVPLVTVRNNALSLLHQLLDQQKHVSKLLIIKREREELKALIKDISSASAQGAKKLEEFAQQDSTLALDVINLPPGEAATREAIATTRKKELLSGSGRTFEQRLLLTQIEALSYAAHLAKVVAENDSDANRSDYFKTLSRTMEDLHARVIQLLSNPAAQR